MGLIYERNEAKDWARENFRGVCNVLLLPFLQTFLD
jgi:hypothetical protein